MVKTLLWINWIGLKRDTLALLLTFALPIMFFSVFVGIFGGMVGGGASMPPVKLIVVDLDQSDISRRFVRALEAEESLRVMLAPNDAPNEPFDEATAESLVRSGSVSVAAIIPKGFGEHFPAFGPATDDTAVRLLTDSQRDPIAHQVVAGLMQKAAMTGAPDLMIERGIEQFDLYAGGLTDQQRDAMDRWLPMLREQLETPGAQEGDDANSAASAFSGMVAVDVVNVQRQHRTDWEAFVSFQAAQTAVMFLLFAMAGMAGTLLEEQESGTLERLLSSRVGMQGLLIGKWLFMALIGAAQLTVMFLWAWKPFGLTIWTVHHVSGFAIMTTATAAAAAAFGLVLATVCRSRAQLGGLSTIIILVMSAIGGSMFPRFMMSDTLQQIGLTTFNAWALDGYRKVFYDRLPLTQLWPQLCVLAAITIVFLLLARWFARRWETT